jgi:hypothetical protein
VATVTGRDVRRYLETEAVRVSKHAARRMEAEGLELAEVLAALAASADVLREYPEDRRGPEYLVLARTGQGEPIHAVLATGQRPWVLVTAYRPDPSLWTQDFRQRRDR